MLLNIISVVLVFWVVGGSIYLFRRHHYSFSKIHYLLMDLIGLPFDFIQKSKSLQRFIPLGFLLPTLILFSLFTYLPFLLNFLFSITEGDSILLQKREYIGLDNYRTLFKCQDYLDLKTCSAAGFNFFKGMINSFLFVLVQVPLMALIALLTALVLNKKIKIRGFWRAMFFYPVMLSPVVVVNIWTWILHRKGMLNISIKSLQKKITALSQWSEFNTLIIGICVLLVFFAIFKTCKIIITKKQAGHPIQKFDYSLAGLFVGLSIFISWWLFTSDIKEGLALLKYRNRNWLIDSNSSTPFFWLVFIYIWAHFGFYMLILLAGLQAIPKIYYDAAQVDGTGQLRVFFRITLPLLMPTLLVVTVLALIKGFQIFDEAWLLTGGGPGRATFMVVQFIYEYGFLGQSKQYGMAATASVVMGAVVGALTFIQLWVTRKGSS